MVRKIMLAAMLAGILGSIAVPASAVIYVRVAPPEPRVEVGPQPRRGYAWSAGHWQWKKHKHVWVAGNWARGDRDGMALSVMPLGESCPWRGAGRTLA